MSQLPRVQVATQYFDCRGGLNLVTPPLTMPGGFVIDSQNFECDSDGGYRRIAGYERFDGHASPHKALYYKMPFTTGQNTLPASGTVLTGATSGATAVSIGIGEGTGPYTAFFVTKVSGVFQAGEAITGYGVLDAVPFIGGESTLERDAIAYAAAADEYRADISAVPGAGPIRGVWVYKDVVYAFRDNVGQTACAMYKSTASGWSLVTTPALSPGGKYEFVNANFGGASPSLNMYGCDGVNKAFQFDGTTFTQITTGMTPDAPKFIAAHRNHLFLSFGASLQHSSIGTPLTWSPVTGAAELALGDDITGIMTVPGNESTAALCIFTRGTTKILYGTSSTDWNLVTYQAETGAIPYTSQAMATVYYLDDRGVMRLDTSANYGNFASGTMSNLIRPWLRDRQTKIEAASISREKNEFRLHYADGYSLYFTIVNGEVIGAMPIYFTNPVKRICSAEFSDGTERIFFGSDNGFVYEMDVGTSIDGDAIDSYMTLAYNHFGSPRQSKRFRKLVIEIKGTTYTDLQCGYFLNYNNADVAQPSNTTFSTALSQVFWDQFTWDSFVWDGRTLAPSEISMTGTAENIALRLTASNNYSAPFTITGFILHYTPRKQVR